MIKNKLSGIAHAPVFAFRKATGGELVSTYLEVFEQIWADAAELR